VEALYVMEPGSFLRKDGDTLKIVQERSTVAEIPAKGLKKLTLIGYTSLSGSVLNFLISNRIETVFMTPTGRFRARLLLDEHHHVARRQAQYKHLGDPGFALNMARAVVQGKLRNQLGHLLRRAREHGTTEELKKTSLQYRSLQKTLECTQSMEAIRGLEGYGARLYFDAFPLLIRTPAFTFAGRNRRPPRDPVNAMLSFVYTLLTNEVLSCIKAIGLDPYLGALHEVAQGRPSLACDLVEEWRVLGDRLVLTLINKKYVHPDDFLSRTKRLPETDPETVRSVEMKPAALRALIQAYERQMAMVLKNPTTGDHRSLRLSILEQVRSYGRCLENPDKPYEPYLLER